MKAGLVIITLAYHTMASVPGEWVPLYLSNSRNHKVVKATVTAIAI